MSTEVHAIRVLAKILQWDVQSAVFHENMVSNSYSFNSKIPNLRVSKIRIMCPKEGWTGP